MFSQSRSCHLNWRLFSTCNLLKTNHFLTKKVQKHVYFLYIGLLYKVIVKGLIKQVGIIKMQNRQRFIIVMIDTRYNDRKYSAFNHAYYHFHNQIKQKNLFSRSYNRNIRIFIDKSECCFVFHYINNCTHLLISYFLV